MNDVLKKFARQTLKTGLAACGDKERHIFKRMYSPKDLTLDINVVVDRMPEEKLDWAMQQVQRSLDIIAKDGS